MLKRWCSIKEIEVYLLCEILISKGTLQGQNKLLGASLKCDSVLKYFKVKFHTKFLFTGCVHTFGCAKIGARKKMGGNGRILLL